MFQVFELRLLGINAQFHLRQQISELARREDGRFDVRCSAGTNFDAGAIVIAAGVGSFQPRWLALAGCEAFEGRSIHYRVRNASESLGKKLVNLGGGDPALDWTQQFVLKAESFTLVHRRNDFRAAPASSNPAVAGAYGCAGQMHLVNTIHGIFYDW